MAANRYTWDAKSKMNTVNASTTLTYDAFGRMVEKNVSGTYTQIVYSPVGKKYAVRHCRRGSFHCRRGRRRSTHRQD